MERQRLKSVRRRFLEIQERDFIISFDTISKEEAFPLLRLKMAELSSSRQNGSFNSSSGLDELLATSMALSSNAALSPLSIESW